MENKTKTDEINELKEQLASTKSELESARKTQVVPFPHQINPQDKFLETLFDKGSDVFEKWLSTTSENEKYAFEKQMEYEKEELKAVQVLDKRDKIYKGIILSICTATLTTLAYFDKAQSVAPVIGVIIGLILKSSSISEFFGGSGKKAIKGDDAE